MVEAAGERVDLQAGRGDGHLAVATSRCAVGIFRVGMAPCGFASGMPGLLPQAAVQAGVTQPPRDTRRTTDHRDDAREHR